jgi:hypothetical protein
MGIDWATLAAIAVVAAAAAVTVVLLVAFAIVGSSAPSGRRMDGLGNRSVSATRAAAVLCLVAAGLIVGYGLYLILA